MKNSYYTIKFTHHTLYVHTHNWRYTHCCTVAYRFIYFFSCSSFSFYLYLSLCHSFTIERKKKKIISFAQIPKYDFMWFSFILSIEYIECGDLKNTYDRKTIRRWFSFNIFIGCYFFSFLSSSIKFST